ncbi:hypothetical protein M3936_02565 [Sutcliffiella horikoshii]|uniref:hypothetical protein n=1 Tax=Sutcliffiella horikoshii TaxID=79883 RepID=UPI002040E207|nr:hypothetical protein [Sutcliffiella horikoshii]MCM3616456.1 hypothetical protein [Sutcliffiella horikoshii]
MPIGSDQIRKRLIQLANLTAVDIWIAGVNNNPTFPNAVIQEVGSDYIRVTITSAGTTRNIIVPILPISSIDDVGGAGVTPTIVSRGLRSRLIEFVGDFTIDIFVTGTTTPAALNVLVTEVGSDYIIGNVGGVNTYLPLTLIAGFRANTAITNTPTVNSRDFRDVLVELSALNSSVIINLGGRVVGTVQAPVNIVEVQSNFIRLNNSAQTVGTIFWIGSVTRLT